MASPDPTDLKTFIAALPKAELHVHLEGTLEPALVRTLAARNNVPLPAALSAVESPSTGYAFHDLTSFLTIYYPALSVLRTATDFHDLTWSYLVKCHAQHVVHTEIFFDAQAHTGRGVPFADVIGGIRQAVLRARRELDVSVGLILCFLRDRDPEWAMATLMEALPYREWIAGVGLDSDERGNGPGKFAGVFARARREGFMLTCHCDVDQEGSLGHIREAVGLGVDRIDHGTNVVEDPRLVEEVRGKGIGLTCCPLSNRVVSSSWKREEMVELLGKGVKVTVNSDDPAYFRGYMSENLMLVAEDGGMSRETLVKLQRNAFEISWISEAQRERFLGELAEFAKANGIDSK